MLWIGEWSHNKLFIPRKDFRAVRVTEQVEASTVKLSLDRTSLAGLRSCLPIKNFSSCIVYRPECHSSIRAGAIKPKGGFYRHEVSIQFPGTYKVPKRLYKKFVLLSEKKIRKTLSTCQKKTAVINVLIFNKLDFQNCFLPFLTLKLYTNIKSLSKSQF